MSAPQEAGGRKALVITSTAEPRPKRQISARKELLELMDPSSAECARQTARASTSPYASRFPGKARV